MKIPFIDYVHGGSVWDSYEHLSKQLRSYFEEDSDFEDLLNKMRHWNYEVTLFCTVDLETGEVELVSAKL